jgi:adenine-specific DNA methylase
MRQFWLAKKNNKKVSLYPYTEGKAIKFKIVGDGYEKMPKNFKPEKGTVSRAIAVCPVCGGVVDDKTTRKRFQEGKAGERMVAVVLHKPGTTGKKYRIATEKDVEVFKSAEKYLEKKRQKLMEECLPAPRHKDGQWYVYVLRCSDGSLYKGFTRNLEARIKDHEAGKVQWTTTRRPVKLVYYEIFNNEKDAIKREKELKTGFGRKWLSKKLSELARQAGGFDPLPDENLDWNCLKQRDVIRYGMLKWGDLFNSRQKLALITFTEKVRLAYQKMIEEGYNKEYAKAVVSYLGLGINRLASYNTSFAPWHVTGEKATQIYGRQALPMVWDFAETNPFAESFSWQVQIDWILNVLSHLSQIPSVELKEDGEDEGHSKELV